MHLTETTLDIINLLGREPFSGESIRSLALRLDKAYPLVHSHISRMREAGLILEEKTGRAIRCTLNFNKPEAQLLLAYTTERTRKENTIHQRIQEINNKKTLLTACTHNEETWLVTNDAQHQEQLRKKLPYTGVQILSDKEFTHLLLETARYGALPKPILHNAVFYEYIGKIQQILKSSWGEQ